jgi:hypothetical protein
MPTDNSPRREPPHAQEIPGECLKPLVRKGFRREASRYDLNRQGDRSGQQNPPKQLSNRFERAVVNFMHPFMQCGLAATLLFPHTRPVWHTSG